MIAMGAGTNHWFHSDEIYRTFLAMVLMCGCQGKNGGGWAHYVGQEKVRPLTGFQTVAFASDWVRPTRHQAATPFFSLLSGQWRYADVFPDRLASPLGTGAFKGMHIADMNALGARLGWLPSFPSFDRSTLDLVDDAERAGVDPAEFVVSELREGRLRFACEDPDADAEPSAGDDGLAGEPAGLVRQGPRVLPQAHAGRGRAGRARRGGRARAPAARRHLAGGAGGEARPLHHHRLPDDLERALLGRRPSGGDLVREARPLDDRSAPVRAHLQSRPSRRRGKPAPTGTRSRRSPRSSRSWPRSISAFAATSSRRRWPTTRPTRSPSPTAACSTGAPGSASRCPARPCPS